MNAECSHCVLLTWRVRMLMRKLSTVLSKSGECQRAFAAMYAEGGNVCLRRV